MNNPIEEQEKVILLLIDKFNEEREKDRLYFLKYRKNSPESGLNKEPFISFYKAFESKATNSEIFDFLYEFGNLRLVKSFHFSNHAESLIQSFEKLNIPIPHFVSECQKEVIQRANFIKTYFENEKFKWSKSKKGDFLSKIQTESKNHSFDQKSEEEYLKKKFDETIQETREIENDIETRFSYYVNDFFDGRIFSISKDLLNEYFYHSEIASGGCGSFFEVFKAFDKYVGKKNEVFALKGFLSGEKEQNSEPEENPNEKSISINSMVLTNLIKELSVYFEGKEDDLKKVLSGEEIEQILYFENNGNKLTDVFFRLHEAGKIQNNKNITAKWICDNFENKNQKSGRSKYKFEVVYKQLTDMSGPINKKRRICENL
ncbi:hypothetical protein LV84_03460 [Algoriphagus ratkowskyi]|uniref:Uncharacterized protein n=1 Tax=Algoriphagus ratkowskyi TaxID=57028 RepID=A0A2W7QW04_9BACT|nr:hypothetical protein [Algoriphagus ratkowskyi]PZX52454.1 hypothetical protein LV84_03460 [Algoriphagus ratkowskyi]TXD76199.1 hypothetical protein ESW18_17360 [Algoriphagus ratkowskyi]